MKMKVFFLLISIVVITGIANAEPPTTQEPSIIFWAEDAVGNRDTVYVYSDSITFDVPNLYGIEPDKDLDLRFIERTDTNAIGGMEVGDVNTPYWLSGGWRTTQEDVREPEYQSPYGWLKSFTINSDVKHKYSPCGYGYSCCGLGWSGRAYVLSLNAVHYPITIYTRGYERGNPLGWNSTIGFYAAQVSIHNQNDGHLDSSVVYKSNLVGIYDTARYEGEPRGDGAFEIIYDSVGSDMEVCKMEQPTNRWLYIVIDCFITSIKEDENTILHPNPASNFLSLENVEYGRYAVFNATGTFIKTCVVNDSSQKLDIHSLYDGHYFMVSDNGKFIYQFIKVGEQ
jgi:hypothetical protein